MVSEDVDVSVHEFYGLDWLRNLFCIMYYIK